MNTTVTDTSPEFLRDAMITKIKEAGYPPGPAVEQALRAVERHLFVPGATIEEAYENDTVVTKRAVDDQVLSCLSQPSIVALQLGQLGVQPGHRVLEIGAGAGYNAALLAYLAGPHGHVTAIDVDADIVEHARQRVAAAAATAPPADRPLYTRAALSDRRGLWLPSPPGRRAHPLPAGPGGRPP